MLPLSASVLSLCLASQEVAIEPYCLANANTLYPDLRYVAHAPAPEAVPAQCTVLQYFSTVCALSGLAS